MRKNVFRAKGLTLLLTAALLVPQMSGVSADAKAKKPTLSRTKVSVTVEMCIRDSSTAVVSGSFLCSQRYRS